MFDILIVSKGGGALRIIRNRLNGKVSLTEYEPLVVSDRSTRINALKGVVCTLEQIYDTRDKISGIVDIYTVGLVADVVQRGTFKYWLLEGKTSNGQEISPTEIELWKEFVELYVSLFKFVNIKNISSVSVKNPRFRITRDQAVLARLVSMAWEKCPEPDVGEDTVADLEEIPF